MEHDGNGQYQTEEVDFIPVLDSEGDDVTELPVEDDGTVLLATVCGQYPKACGLKYRSETGNFRAIRCSDDILYPPKDGWGGNTFFVVYPKGEKRKTVDDSESSSAAATSRHTPASKRSYRDERGSSPPERGGGTGTEDLIVLGLPWKWDDADIKSFFSDVGNVIFAEVKKDRASGRSKGFGFIRFENLEDQEACLSKKHESNGRYLDVKLSGGSSGVRLGAAGVGTSKKIFVGKVSPDVDEEDVRSYFSKYGEITDMFMPKPHRGFAFVTFHKANIVHKLYCSHW